MVAAAVNTVSMSASRDLANRIDAIDWQRLSDELGAQGHAIIPSLLQPKQCSVLAELYAAGDLFRSRVVMSRHGFGRGEYQYFKYPLPELVASLRSSLYSHLAPIANRWNDLLGIDVRFPSAHEETSRGVTKPGSCDRRHCCFSIEPTITTACIKTCMESMSFRCRSPCCCRNRDEISPAVNSF